MSMRPANTARDSSSGLTFASDIDDIPRLSLASPPFETLKVKSFNEFRAPRSRPCRPRLALRGSAQGGGAAGTDSQSGGPVRDRLRSVGPAAYRHFRRGG